MSIPAPRLQSRVRMLGATWLVLPLRACDFIHRQGHDEGEILDRWLQRRDLGRCTVAKPKIVSREYKLLLRATPFQGNDAQLTQAARAFWHDFGGRSDLSLAIPTVAWESRSGA
jgi:hypothetical protein